MILLTTPTPEGHPITKYCGMVTRKAISGANIFRDFFARIRDIVGGGVGFYEKEPDNARQIPFRENMLMASISGTAVKRSH